jgi:hypothetical protein
MNTNSNKIFSWKTAILLSVGVGLLTAGLSIALQTHGLTVQYVAQAIKIAEVLPVDAPMPVVNIDAAVGIGASYDIPGKPVRLIIPAIGVDANIQAVGLSWRGNGDMGVPTNFTDVGWYKNGPLPGMPGSAVIDGHLDGKNVAKAVFYDLDKLIPGDLVEVVDKEGKTKQFRVIETKTYDSEAPTERIFAGSTSTAQLNLITCAGDWNKSDKSYDKRIVVFTEIIESD